MLSYSNGYHENHQSHQKIIVFLMEQKLFNNCNTAKKINLIKFLASENIFPKKENIKEAWFISPFREEKTPSFKVNKQMNKWYDFGEGVGGNIIDFVVKKQKINISEALKYIYKNKPIFSGSIKPLKNDKITIINIKKLTNHNLIKYIRSRKIDLDIAFLYCNEIEYSFKGKNYYSIGFKNMSDGYELRNKLIKNCASPKNISLIKTGSNKIAVFEGFFDMLSYFTLIKNKTINIDVLVLNSISFFSKSIDFLKNYNRVYLFLDNDSAGEKATQFYIKNLRDVRDYRIKYKNYNDLNDYLISVKG